MYTPDSQAIEFTEYDTRTWRHVGDGKTLVEDICTEHYNRHNSAPVSALQRHQSERQDRPRVREMVDSIAFDTFNQMYRVNPTMSKSGGTALARAIAERVSGDDEYAELHAHTAYDETSSYLAASGMMSKVIRRLTDEDPNLVKDSATEDANRKELESERELRQFLNGKELRECEERITELEGIIDGQQNDNAKRLAYAGKSLQQAIHESATESIEEAKSYKETCEMFKSIAGNTSGGTSTMTHDVRKQAMALASNESWKKMMQLLGRMRASIQAKRSSKSEHDSGAYVDVTLGDDISLLLDEELSAMRSSHRMLRLMALQRYADESMMQHQVESKQPLDRGDVVVMLDRSSSMDGQRIVEAKAMALAIALTALQDNRRVYVIPFDLDVKDFMGSAFVPNDAENYDAIRRLMELSAQGGTSFDRAITYATNKVEESSQLDNADIVMITDGADRIDEQVWSMIAAAQSKGVSYYAIGTDGFDPTEFNAFDGAWRVDSFADTEAVGELAARI